MPGFLLKLRVCKKEKGTVAVPFFDYFHGKCNEFDGLVPNMVLAAYPASLPF